MENDGIGGASSLCILLTLPNSLGNLVTYVCCSCFYHCPEIHLVGNNIPFMVYSIPYDVVSSGQSGSIATYAGIVCITVKSS